VSCADASFVQTDLYVGGIMEHLKTMDEIKSHAVKDAVVKMLADCHHIKTMLNLYFMGEGKGATIHFREPQVALRRESDHAYEDDGHTKCPATRYYVMIALQLHGGELPKEVQFHEVYNGRGSGDGAIAFLFSATSRDRDGKVKGAGEQHIDCYWRGWQHQQERFNHSWRVSFEAENFAYVVKAVEEFVVELQRRRRFEQLEAELLNIKKRDK
jgi:hypothetical protein